MKTKLTLTVRQSVITSAKRYSRKTGKSISQLVEEFFETMETNTIKTEPQRAAEHLIQLLEASSPKKTLNDKAKIKDHVARKYA